MDWIGLIANILRYGMLVVFGWFLWLLLTAIRTDLQQKPLAQVKNWSVGLEVMLSTGDKLLPGQVYPLNKELLVGREEGNDIIVEDTFASNKHARIWLHEHVCWVEDLDSTNGTFLNGSKLNEKAILNFGDLLKVGGATFRLIK